MSCGVQTDLVEVAAALEALHASFDGEHAHALAPRGGIGLHRGDHEVGVDAVRDERLRPVDHEVVAVTDRGGGDGTEIAAGVRLGHGDGRHDLPGTHAWQPAGLLFLGRQIEQVGEADVVVRREAQRHTGISGVHQLLGDDGVVAEVAHAAATVGRGCRHAEEAAGAGRREQLARHDAGPFPFLEVWRHLAFDEASERGAEHLVFFGEDRAFHRSSYIAVQPPSTHSTWPVIHEASSPARNATLPAMSARLAEPPERDVPDDVVTQPSVVERVGGHRSQGVTGRHHVHADAVAGPFDGEGAAERDEAALRRAVGRPLRHAHHREHRGDVDDTTRRRCGQQWLRRPQQTERCGEPDRDLLVPRVVARVGKARLEPVTGAVHDDVEPTEPLGRRDHLLCRAGRGDVDRNGDRTRHGRARVGRTRQDRDHRSRRVHPWRPTLPRTVDRCRGSPR